ncbi:MAG TPA: DsrE family protein [Burkholderiales bacterium]|nr:DsrE family protein [Burkholderiales bacterium]
MTRIRARLVLASTALLIAAWATSASAGPQGPAEPDKVVYHVNDSANATAALRNIGNHLEVNPQAKIVVVTHAQGVDFLMEGAKDKNGNPYNIPVEELAGKGVVFDVCEITLRNRKLEKKQFIPEVKFVPSGVAELGKLQSREGYAYIKP